MTIVRGKKGEPVYFQATIGALDCSATGGGWERGTGTWWKRAYVSTVVRGTGVFLGLDLHLTVYFLPSSSVSLYQLLLLRLIGLRILLLNFVQL